MKRAIWMLTICVVVAMVTTSCKKDLFDQQKAEELLKYEFHNDTIDANHTWTLLNDLTLNITANVAGTDHVEVLSANPYAGRSEILGTAIVRENEQTTLYCSVPDIQDSIYVAAVDGSGKYTVVAIKPTSRDVNFTTLNTRNTGQLTAPTLQEVWYCFCTGFPDASATWGFNDLVLHVSKEVVNEYRLRLNVTLAAVGTTNQLAAALRLNNVRFSDVASVTVDGPSNAFIRYPDRQRLLIESSDLLLEARDGTAVINLFDDAHAVYKIIESSNGVVTRALFNVSHDVLAGAAFAEWSPVTVSYDIVFREPGRARRISYGDFDPFIVYYRLAMRMEVHKYTYKLHESLNSMYEGKGAAYDNGYTWALEVPYTWFRYPTYGNAMGSYKNGAIFGAYQRMTHSFGEWAADRNTAKDWYLYPVTTMVY